MLLRKSASETIAIAQTSHAWICEQLARAWGNERHTRPEPFEDVCLAALLHDSGWVRLEINPTFSEEQRRLHDFMEISLPRKLEDAARGVRITGTYSLYAAVVVSLHFTSIYGAISTPEAKAFAKSQIEFQNAALAALRHRPSYVRHATPGAIERARLLVGAVDRLSIALCVGVTDQLGPIMAPGALDEIVSMRLSRSGDSCSDVFLSPWPFATSELLVECEGRRLGGTTGPFAVEQWNDLAQRVTIEIRLRPFDQAERAEPSAS